MEGLSMHRDKKTVSDQAETKRYSRHDFLTVSGTALAGGALAAYSPKETEANEKAKSKE